MSILHIDDKKIRRQDIKAVKRATADTIKVILLGNDNPRTNYIKIPCDGFRSAEYLMYNLRWFMEHPHWPTLIVWQYRLGYSVERKFRGHLEMSVAYIV